jgi:mitogen-activated protein kinase kinase kinase
LINEIVSELELELQKFCVLAHNMLTPQVPANDHSLPDDAKSSKEDEEETITSDSYVLSTFLGKGQNGMVYRADDKQGNPKYAVKCVILKKSVGAKLVQKPTFISYQKVLQKIRHENIVRYLGWHLINDHEGRLVLELCEQGSLEKIIHKDPSNPGISEATERLRWLKEILQGLAYLHSHGIVHRDIKPSNIFIRNNQAKIGDFGSARIQQSCCSKSHQTKLSGTCLYVCPEAVRGEIIYHKCAEDIWSLGCVAYEMLTGKIPWFDLSNEFAVLFQIGQLDDSSSSNSLVEGAKVTPHITASEKLLIEGALTHNGETRPTASLLLKILETS